MPAHLLPHLLLALAVVIIAGRLVGILFTRAGQPAVLGEVAAGILLGPSLLGRIAPDATGFLFPSALLPVLGALAQLGVILYMFLIGLELNAGLLRRKAVAALAVSHAGIFVPFLLGLALAPLLYPRLAGAGVPLTSFMLFLGVAMSITAFPVLARILADRGLTATALGVFTLACAATDDVTAWCLLAVVLGATQAEVGGALVVLGLAVLYVLGMLLLVRPLARRLAARYHDEEPPQIVIALVLAAVLLSALATEAIGIHALFGAFLLGALVPHDSGLARALTRRLHDVVTVVLLPAFFAFTGLRTEIGLLTTGEDWLLCGLIVLTATAGKFGGCLIAARCTGQSWHTSLAVGALMNTRGLMELLVLNIGLELGVISPALFAMMVLMALATTLAAGPMLDYLQGHMPKARDEDEPIAPIGPAGRTRMGAESQTRS